VFLSCALIHCSVFTQLCGSVAEPRIVNSELIVDRSLIARSSVRTHLSLAFGVLVLIAAAVTGYAVLAVDHVRSAQERTSVRAVPYLTGLSDAALAAKSAANDERGFLLSGAKKYADEAQGRRAAELAGLNAGRGHASSTAERAAVDEISAGLDRFNQAQDAEFQLYLTDRQAAIALSNGANRDLRKTYEAAFAKGDHSNHFRVHCLNRGRSSFNCLGLIMDSHLVSLHSEQKRSKEGRLYSCPCRKLHVGYSGGAARPISARPMCDRPSGRRGESVHPYAVTSVCELRCSIFDMR